jgi:hypothetical protein
MNGEATTTKSMGRFGERSGRFVNTLDLVDLRSGGLHIEYRCGGRSRHVSAAIGLTWEFCE